MRGREDKGLQHSHISVLSEFLRQMERLWLHQSCWAGEQELTWGKGSVLPYPVLTPMGTEDKGGSLPHFLLAHFCLWKAFLMDLAKVLPESVSRAVEFWSLF